MNGGPNTNKSVTLIGVHSRGIAPQTHEIVTLGAHYFPRPLLLTLTRMASLNGKPPCSHLHAQESGVYQ